MNSVDLSFFRHVSTGSRLTRSSHWTQRRLHLRSLLIDNTTVRCLDSSSSFSSSVKLSSSSLSPIRQQDKLKHRQTSYFSVSPDDCRDDSCSDSTHDTTRSFVQNSDTCSCRDKSCVISACHCTHLSKSSGTV